MRNSDFLSVATTKQVVVLGLTSVCGGAACRPATLDDLIPDGQCVPAPPLGTVLPASSGVDAA
jgi:hypothetical protein